MSLESSIDLKNTTAASGLDLLLDGFQEALEEEAGKTDLVRHAIYFFIMKAYLRIQFRTIQWDFHIFLTAGGDWRVWRIPGRNCFESSGGRASPWTCENQGVSLSQMWVHLAHEECRTMASHQTGPRPYDKREEWDQNSQVQTPAQSSWLARYCRGRNKRLVTQYLSLIIKCCIKETDILMFHLISYYILIITAKILKIWCSPLHLFHKPNE